MKINNKQAADALLFVSKIATPSIVSMYGNVIIKSSNGVVKFTCTNAQTTLTASCESNDDISACVDAKKLATFFKNASSDIDLQVKDGKLIAKSGRSRASLAMHDGEGFPIPSCVESEAVNIDGSALKMAIEKVSYAAGKNDSRPAANGVYLGSNHVVCTQGTLLAAYPIELGMDAILPAPCLPSLGAMLGGNCECSIDKNSAHFKCGAYELHTKLVSTQYFRWESVIPKTNKSITLSRSALAKSLSSVQVAANSKTSRIVLSVEGMVMKISATDQSNSLSDEIDVFSSDEDVEIMFNVNYLISTCNALDGENIDIGYTEYGKPIRISDGGNGIHIVTPQK